MSVRGLAVFVMACFSRFLLLLIVLFAFSLSPTARAEENGDTPAAANSAPVPPDSGQFMVTPVHDCYAKLDRDEAFDVRRNFENPYQECLRRVSEKEKKAKKEKDSKAAAPKTEKDGDSDTQNADESTED